MEFAVLCYSLGSRKVCCMLVFNFALFNNFLLRVFCLTNIVFVQCSPFGTRSLLHAYVVSNYTYVSYSLPHQLRACALLFPSAPNKFTPFCFAMFYSVFFCYAYFTQQAEQALVCAVIFPRFPLNLHA